MSRFYLFLTVNTHNCDSDANMKHNGWTQTHRMPVVHSSTAFCLQLSWWQHTTSLGACGSRQVDTRVGSGSALPPRILHCIQRWASTPYEAQVLIKN